jgi:hypothetical protein
MDRIKKSYLLPCNCSADIEVVSGQAGGSVTCPACGRQNDVPKLRDFEQLKTRSQSSGKAAGGWSAMHALALAGAASAAIAFAAAAVVGSTPRAAFDPERVRSDILASEDDARLYRALQEYSSASVSRGAMREEVDLQRRAIFATGMARTLQVLGGLGAVVAVAAGLMILAAPKAK